MECNMCKVSITEIWFVTYAPKDSRDIGENIGLCVIFSAQFSDNMLVNSVPDSQ